MKTRKPENSKTTTRRKFLLAAGATGAAAVAMPQVSRAQTVTLKYQSTWPTKDIFHEMAVDYAKQVNDMTGGRLRIDVLAAGAVVPAFQMQDAVHAGMLDAGHGVCAYWYGKHKAFSLFGTPPSFGWDAHGFLGWIYYGGGEALYNELVNNILKLNLVGFLSVPMPTQPLGWFKKPVAAADDLKGLKYRTVGLSGRSVQGDGRGGDHPAGRRDRAGHGSRPARRGGVQQPVVGHPARLPGRVEGLHAAEPPSAGRILRDHLQQGRSTTRCRPS